MIDFNALINADISGIDIELPEDLGDRLVEVMLQQTQLVDETAVALYGPEPTPEQLSEAGILIVLYAKKRLAEMTNPEI